MDWFGLGKKRSKLGKWLDRHGVSQVELAKRSGVSRPTVTRLCTDDDHSPTMNTAKKLMKALKELDPRIDYDDFWSM